MLIVLLGGYVMEGTSVAASWNEIFFKAPFSFMVHLIGNNTFLFFFFSLYTTRNVSVEIGQKFNVIA